MYQPLLSPGQTIAQRQRNISQHCWTKFVACVWPPCGDVFRRAGCCWLKFEIGQIWANNCTPSTSLHVATRWPNKRNMLRTIMLRYVALVCFDCLAGALWMQRIVSSINRDFSQPLLPSILWRCAVRYRRVCWSFISGSNGVALVSKRFVLKWVWSRFSSFEPGGLVSIFFVRSVCYLYQFCPR